MAQKPPGSPGRPDWFPKNIPDLPKFNVNPRRFRFAPLLIVVAALVVLSFLSRCFVVVQAGERAVIFSKVSGVQRYQLSEGMHFNVPILWQPTVYDVKTLTYTMSGSATESQGEASRAPESGSDEQTPDDSLQALTQDGLPVTVDLSIRFHIQPDEVWKLHEEIGPEFISKIVRPQARSLTRTVFAEYPVTDVYSNKRQAIVERIQKELSEEFQKSYLTLDEVLLRDIRFPQEFQAAIEQKQVALQQAEQMKYELQRAEKEKQQKVIEAEGEAAAIRKKADALAQNPQLIQYEYIQKLNPNVRIVVNDGKSIINMSNLFDGSSTKEQP
jgi:regulator of protease activity HflC (stomatin/prohibitin superfamily)